MQRRLNLESHWHVDYHRSGWPYLMDSIQPLHSPGGTLFDGCVEKTFAWDPDQGRETIYERPWIGCMHNPPKIPPWCNHERQSPADILSHPAFQKSLELCRGIFVFSHHLRDWLAPRIPVPVETLLFPTLSEVPVFDPERLRAQERPVLVHCGVWLRRFSSFFKLEVPGYRKLLLQVNQPWALRNLDFELRNFVDRRRRDSVELCDYLPAGEYDDLLARSVVFIELYDSSANNTVVECIVRATPLAINKIPAVVEYLGADYPLYFTRLSEAERKLADPEVLAAAHAYLAAHPLRERLSGECFRESLVRTGIYQALPDPV